MSEAFAQPYPPEFHEHKILEGVIDLLHNHKESAIQLQNDQRQAHDRALQPLRAANYAVNFENDLAQIPAWHWRVIFGPQYGSHAYEGLERIVARFPITSTEEYPEQKSEAPDIYANTEPVTKPWNDVFIELIDTDGQRQNYLLNSKGLTAFEDADDVPGDFDYDNSGDLFTVTKPVLQPVVEIDLFTLSYLLTQDAGDPDKYVYQQQTNELDPPRYY